MPYEDAANYRFNPFDVTKVWPHEDYPPITVGRFVLDRNPENFFAQIVEAAFDVANFVPGIGPSPDRMVLGRMFAYADSNRYRSGPNYAAPVNRPLDGCTTTIRTARCATTTMGTSRSTRPTATAAPRPIRSYRDRAGLEGAERHGPRGAPGRQRLHQPARSTGR